MPTIEIAKSPTSSSRKTVQSVERSLDLLEALATEPLGLTELSDRTGLVPSTTHRLLATLSRRGYVTRQLDTGRYELGYKMMAFEGDRARALSSLRRKARPALESIQQATGETTNLVVLDGDQVIYVDQVEGRHAMRMQTTLGQSVLAHTTASGKALLAFGPPERVSRIYGNGTTLQRLTPRTIATVDDLRTDLKRIKRRGYSVDIEEHEEGVTAVAVPILDETDGPCAAISVSAPTARITQGGTRELGTLLRHHAGLVSSELETLR
jgi:IclR family acetate operon transcriptional repressor